MLARWSQAKLKSILNALRIACVVGCRQSGKTTLVKNACPRPFDYVTLDSDSYRNLVAQDPSFFVQRRDNKCLVIDEIQKMPQLIGEIKIAVDENPEKGQYIITGSADYRKLPHAKESLAGRVGFVRVRTFTEAELRGCDYGFLKRLFDEQIPLSCDQSLCNKPLIFNLAVSGGFYETQTDNPNVRAQWFESYVEQQVLLDMRDQWGTRKLDRVREMFGYVAAFSSNPFVTRTASQQLQINLQTIDSYLSSIEAMYLIDRLPAWTLKDYDRPKKTPKLFMTDSGLMSYLLGIGNIEDKIFDPVFASNPGGKLIETWTYNQLIAEVELHPRWTMHHLRTRTHEINFLITDENGDMLAIDIKSGQSVEANDARHIRWFQELVAPSRCIGIVLYAGNNVLSFGNHCYAIPLAAMWDYRPRPSL